VVVGDEGGCTHSGGEEAVQVPGWVLASRFDRSSGRQCLEVPAVRSHSSGWNSDGYPLFAPGAHRHLPLRCAPRCRAPTIEMFHRRAYARLVASCAADVAVYGVGGTTANISFALRPHTLRAFVDDPRVGAADEGGLVWTRNVHPVALRRLSLERNADVFPQMTSRT
jgi:hypothetical protein